MSVEHFQGRLLYIPNKPSMVDANINPIGITTFITNIIIDKNMSNNSLLPPGLAPSSLNTPCDKKTCISRADTSVSRRINPANNTLIGNNARFIETINKGQYLNTNNLHPYLTYSGNVSFAPGKIIIDGVNLKLPDYDTKIKEEYQRGLKEISAAACAEKTNTTTIGFATTIAVWILIIMIIVGLIWYFFSSSSSSTK